MSSGAEKEEIYKPYLIASVLGIPRSGKSCLVASLGERKSMPFYLAENINQQTETKHPCFYHIDKFQKYDLVVHDLPGNPKYIKNLYRQLCTSDAFIITVPADYYKLYQSKTRYLGQLGFIAGIEQIIIAVTKMDTVQFSEREYHQAFEHTSQLLLSIGFKKNAIKFCIPTVNNGIDNGNILEASPDMPWYTGNTIYSAFELLSPRKFNEKEEFLFSVLKYYRPKGQSPEIYGRIVSGNLTTKDTLTLVSNGNTSRIYHIKDHRYRWRETSKAGDMIFIEMNLQDTKYTGKTVLKNTLKSEVKFAVSFKCKIMILSSHIAITEGFTPISHVNQTMFLSKWTFFEKNLSKKTGNSIKIRPDFLTKGDLAVIECELITPFIYLQPFKENQQFGRIFFRDGYTIVAAGVILSVEYTDFRTREYNENHNYYLYGRRAPKQKSKKKNILKTKKQANRPDTIINSGRLTKAAGTV